MCHVGLGDWGLGVLSGPHGDGGDGMGDSMSAFERVVLVVGTSAHPSTGSDSS